MIKVGVTGGIGSGKSLICEIFEKSGYAVYYADNRAKELIASNKEIQKEITALLGDEAFTNGEYNRRFVAEKVFADTALLNGLNAIVHPRMEDDFKLFVQQATGKFVFKESALLFETKEYEQLDEIIYVSAPTALRIDRVLKRDAFRTKEEIENIIDKQIPESKAVLLADYIVVNDEVESVLEQLEEIEEILSF